MDLKERVGLDWDSTQSLIQYVSKQVLHSKMKRAENGDRCMLMTVNDIQNGHLKTGILELDDHLLGGIPECVLTEVAGPPGQSSKSHF